MDEIGDGSARPAPMELSDAELNELRAITAHAKREAMEQRLRAQREAARAELEQARAPKTTAPQARRPKPSPTRATATSATPCAWCGAPVPFRPQESTARCNSCGLQSAAGRCPDCGFIGFFKLDGERAICASCGTASPAAAAGQPLSRTGREMAKFGCALTALVWLVIPALVVLVVVLVALLSD